VLPVHCLSSSVIARKRDQGTSGLARNWVASVCKSFKSQQQLLRTCLILERLSEVLDPPVQGRNRQLLV